jgi:5'-methylthioadenosine phosphorylase
MNDDKPILAVIGGSGLYQMPGIDSPQEYDLDTPFGKPSAPIVVGGLSGKRVAFLARHGLGHTLSPSEVNYRANVYALKMLGVERIVSISACGSLREDYAPGSIVIPDQLFDFTRGSRKRTFFETGLVAHVGTADPYCQDLSALVGQSAESAGAVVHPCGTLITIEGPRFSTKAESNLFRAWGMAIIGMTACPEAFLAREAEMCYVTMAHVTDYDVWHTTEETVSVEMVIHTLNQNTLIAQEAVRNLVKTLGPERTCDCGSALQNALITAPERIDPGARKRTALLVDKYLAR